VISKIYLKKQQDQNIEMVFFAFAIPKAKYFSFGPACRVPTHSPLIRGFRHGAENCIACNVQL
jgi:hypothetical protein